MTSECGTVLAVDVRHGDMAATMDDGRIQRFAGDDLDAAHLAHGYAVTVHRSQGATVAPAHALEDGGGRELAYVKMSRAKEHTTVYAVADDVEQAVEDLGRSWAMSRRIGWAIDRSVPSKDSSAVQAAKAMDHTVAAHIRHARLVVEREALAAVIPPDADYAYHAARSHVENLEYRLDAMDRGDGYGMRGTSVGDAAIAWKQALGEWGMCLSRAEHAGWRERHQLRRQAAKAAERAGPLKEAFETLAGAERSRIHAELPEARKLAAELQGQYAGHLHFQIKHPEALRRLERLDQEMASAAWEMDVDRQDLDGIPPRPREVPQPSRGPTERRPCWSGASGWSCEPPRVSPAPWALGDLHGQPGCPPASRPSPTDAGFAAGLDPASVWLWKEEGRRRNVQYRRLFRRRPECFTPSRWSVYVPVEHAVDGPAPATVLQTPSRSAAGKRKWPGRCANSPRPGRHRMEVPTWPRLLT